MPTTSDASPHSHGRSEVLDRPNITRLLRDAGKILGLRLRTLRRERELNQEEAAELIGIHSKHVQRIESGRGSNVTFATLIAICVAFGIPLEKLLTGIAAQPAPKPLPPKTEAAAPKPAPLKTEAAAPKTAPNKAAPPKAKK